MEESYLKERGFNNENEFFKMISSYRMESNKDIVSFNVWKNEDGTKEGLKYLLDNQQK